MKSMIRNTLFLLFIVACLSLGVSFAQDKTGQDPQIQRINEALAADEKLPFTQTENAYATSEPSSAGIIFRTLGAMALIAGIIFGGAWGLKKMGFGNQSAGSADGAPELKILASVSLGNGRTVSTLLFGDRVILIGSTAHSFTLLADEFESKTTVAIEKPRSVADMLAAENISFEKELAMAENGLSGGLNQ